jgi:GAF domain-containing protein
MVLRTAAPGGLLRVNRAFQELFGLSAADLETTPLPDWIHPDDRPAFQAALDARTGCVVARHRRADGEWVELAWQLREGGQGCVALGRPEAAPQSTAPHMQRSALTVSASRTDTLHAMAKIVEAKNPGMRCSILLVDAAGECVTVGAGPSLPAEYNAAVEGLHIGPGVGSCGTAAFWNVPIVVEDIDVDPLWSGLRSAAKIAGVRACWSHPVTATHGGVLGAMALYNDTPRSPR